MRWIPCLPYYRPAYYLLNNHTYRRPSLPPVDISTFQKSIANFPPIMQSVTVFLQAANNSSLLHKIKAAAQESKTSVVKSLIQSTGVTSELDVSFTPDYIRIVFIHPDTQFDCCHITLSIRW
ncbi:hypothetical protein FZC66_18270 [Priestia megaterium]|nr:hypothetical protein FZC66_18270 [Priestia megaterium]